MSDVVSQELHIELEGALRDIDDQLGKVFSLLE